jgi:uncharacterized phiE125 gp8 family phage protein
MKAFPRRAGSPLAEPITLAEALTHLRETADSGANDAYITSLITVARMACEDRIERSLVSTPWLLKLDAFPEAIDLTASPVIAVQSVQYLDEAGALQTLDPLDYVVDTQSEPGYLVPAPEAAWPAVQSGAINAVRVSFTAGYGSTAASVPAPLKHWILLALTELYETRSGSSDRPQVRHDFADGLLNPYRMLGV